MSATEYNNFLNKTEQLKKNKLNALCCVCRFIKKNHDNHKAVLTGTFFKECHPGNYGDGCAYTCFGCIGNVCDPRNGECEKEGCITGFTGLRCQFQGE